MGYASGTSFDRFPNPGWAWPRHGLDQLIFAAVSPDHASALDSFKTWLGENDINDVSFREHRLLAAIAGRFGKQLQDHQEYPRLVGLQRLLWTKSRMAMAEAMPELRILVERQIPVMLIKGAVRLALRSEDQKSRMFHDLDILVPPDHFVEAMDALFEAGWSGSSGESRLCLAARHADIRGMNFFKGRFGDIDLHQRAYGLAHPFEGAEAALWEHSVSVTFFKLPVLVPSPEDRLALAIHHSGRDAHNHSDWVVDCARYLGANGLDWDRLLAILEETETIVPAQVALSYLNQHIGMPMPTHFTTRLMNHTGTGTAGRLLDILQAKPRNDWGPLSRTARGIAKQIRMRKQNPAKRRARIITGRSASLSNKLAGEMQTLQFLGAAKAGSTRFVLELEVELTGIARRLEFELNSENRHLARLQIRHFLRRNGWARLKFSSELTLKDSDQEIWLEARPGRQLRGGETKKTTDRYRMVPFRLALFQLKA
jgi:hypothetical protein